MDTPQPARPEVRALIFDLGGVILRTDDPYPRTALAERLGKTRAEIEEIVFANPVAQQAERGLATPEEVWAEIARRLGRPVDEMRQVRREFFAGDHVDFALIDLIQALRERYRTALLSNTWIVDLPRFLSEELQIPDTFDFVISSAGMRKSKPDPEIFHLALEMVGVRPEEAIFVDDNRANITAASGLGIRTVRFSHTGQLRQDLSLYIDLPGGKPSTALPAG
jgi:epoxide hydrolase-like predicted phosphatase